MAYYDENGNLIGDEGQIPTFPQPAPREVVIELKDGETDSKAKVDADGSLNVKVTDMPPITVNAEGIEVSVSNTVEVTNDDGNPIPVAISGTPNVNATISGNVAISNFPATQSIEGTVVIDDTTAVKIDVQNTSLDVNITNPATDVSVNNFPTSIEVDGTVVIDDTIPLNVEVGNFPLIQEVSGTINVGNASLSVEVTNQPTSIEVSNFPTVQTVSGTVDVSNHPTSMEISNFPTNQVVTVDNQITSIEVSNLPSLDDEADYIDDAYILYNDLATNGVYPYADAMPPTVDAFGRKGWHYLNNYAEGAPVGQKKINWYYYDSTRIDSTYANFQNAFAVVQFDKTRLPFFVVYTGANGVPQSTYVFATGGAVDVGKTYLVWAGASAPPTDIYPDLPRLQLTLTIAQGIKNSSEKVLNIAYSTDSSYASGSCEFQVYRLGMRVNNKQYVFRNRMRVENTQTTAIQGAVEITNDAGNAIPVSVNNFPTNQTVTVSNPTSSVEVSNLPSNQDVTITNTAPITVDVNNLSFPEVQQVSGTVSVDNFPTSTQVSNIVTVQGTVDVGNLTFPETQDVNITNTSLNVEGAVSVDSLPAITIQNTGFDANITNSSLTVVGEVDVTSLPAITIENTGFDANITNTNLNVTVSNNPTTIDVSNFPTTQNVEIVNTLPISVNVDNQLSSIEVSNLPTTQDVNITNASINATVSGTVDVGNLAFPTVQEVSGTVNIDSTIPVSVNVANQITSIDVDSLPAITIQNTGFDANITNTNLDVTVSNFPTTQAISGTVSVDTLPSITIANTGFEVTNQPIVTVDDTVPIDVNITNSLTIEPPANQNVTITNANPINISGDVTVSSLPNITIQNTGFDANITNTNLDVTVSNQITAVDVNNFPATQDVNVTNQITSVDVTTLPAITIQNTGFEVTNTPNVIVSNTSDINVNVTNQPTSIEVSNFPTTQAVSGTVDIGTIPNITIANPQTSVDVTSLPAITIGNTGFDANITNTNLNVTVDNQPTSIEVSNFPTTQAISGTVSVDSLPAITIANTGFNVTNSPTVKIDSADNTVKIASGQSIGVSGTANVSFNGTAQPVNATITGAGTSAASPLYMVIVGSIDGGVIG